MAFVDDIQRKEYERTARQIVCDVCPFTSKCDGHEYTPVCLWSNAEEGYNYLMDLAEQYVDYNEEATL